MISDSFQQIKKRPAPIVLQTNGRRARKDARNYHILLRMQILLQSLLFLSILTGQRWATHIVCASQTSFHAKHLIGFAVKIDYTILLSGCGEAKTDFVMVQTMFE